MDLFVVDPWGVALSAGALSPGAPQSLVPLRLGCGLGALTPAGGAGNGATCPGRGRGRERRTLLGIRHGALLPGLLFFGNGIEGLRRPRSRWPQRGLQGQRGLGLGVWPGWPLPAGHREARVIGPVLAAVRRRLGRLGPRRARRQQGRPPPGEGLQGSARLGLGSLATGNPWAGRCQLLAPLRWGLGTGRGPLGPAGRGRVSAWGWEGGLAGGRLAGRGPAGAGVPGIPAWAGVEGDLAGPPGPGAVLNFGWLGG